eukprot:246252-Rhodomonas_salina.1
MQTQRERQTGGRGGEEQRVAEDTREAPWPCAESAPDERQRACEESRAAQGRERLLRASTRVCAEMKHVRLVC